MMGLLSKCGDKNINKLQCNSSRQPTREQATRKINRFTNISRFKRRIVETMKNIASLRSDSIVQNFDSRAVDNT